MMKTMKRVGALLLVVAMVLALGVSAFAGSDAGEETSSTKSSDYTDDYTITISNTSKDKTYSAYQILDATWVDSDGDGKTDSVAYTIQPDSIWFYIVSQGSNLNESNDNPVFTLQAVYKAGTDVVDYYTVTAADGRADLDGNTATDAIIDYLLANINMIVETGEMAASGNEVVDSYGNPISTGLAYITSYVYVYDEETKSNVIETDSYGDPVTQTILLIPAGTDSTGTYTMSDGESTYTYAEVAEAYGCDDYETAAVTGTGTGANLTLNLGSDAAGYYFVTTTTGTTVSVTTADPDASIIDKNIVPGGTSTPPPTDEDEPGDGTPWLDKYIVVGEDDLKDHEDLSGNEEDEDEYEWDYAMGDDVVFNVTSDVPLYGDTNKDYGSGNEGGDETQASTNNAELIYQYVFTDEMTDGVNIKLSTTEVPTIGNSSTDSTYVYSVTDDNGTVHYYLTDTALNNWITITDGAGAEYVFTQVTYYYSLELYDLVAVCNPKEGDDSGKYYTVPVEELTSDDSVTYYAASGFKLVYYTYDVDAYYTAIGKWLEEHKDDMVWDEVNEVYVDADYSWTNLPDEALAYGWEAAYTSKTVGDAVTDSEGNVSYPSCTQYPATAEILIEYNAVVSDVAIYDNTNTVTMDYYVVSWDYYPPVGEVNPEEPDNPPKNPPDGPNDGTPGTHSGQTVQNDIFTWELNINKVAEDGETPLEGAVFTLEGETLNRVKVTTNTYTLVSDYENYNTETVYYLVDGSYVTLNAASNTAKAAAAASVYGEYYENGSKYISAAEYAGFNTSTLYYYHSDSSVYNTTVSSDGPYYYNSETRNHILVSAYNGINTTNSYYLIDGTYTTLAGMDDGAVAAALASVYGEYYQQVVDDAPTGNYMLASTYEAHSSEQYWLLADGETYVTESPYDSAHPENYYGYDSEGKTFNDAVGPYYCVTDYTMEVVSSNGTSYAYGTTDANGNLTFSGLEEGKYILTEIAAPDGYNVLSDPIYFEVIWYDAGESYTGIDGATVNVEEPVFVITFWEASEEGVEGAVKDTNTGLYWIATSISEIPQGNLGTATYEETVVNVPGTLLPGTGGIGTTVFYIIGGCLVVGAVVVLVTRKRVGKEEEA